MTIIEFVGEIPALSEAGRSDGPFLFAIVFLAVGLWLGVRAERLTTRWKAIVTSSFAGACLLASFAGAGAGSKWWLSERTENVFYFTGTITDLDAGDDISPTDGHFHFKGHTREMIQEHDKGSEPRKEVRFLWVGSTPPALGYLILYWKPKGEINHKMVFANFEYDSTHDQRYTVEPHPTAEDRYILKALTMPEVTDETVSSTRWSIISSAYAESEAPQRGGVSKSSQVNPKFDWGETDKYARALQNERTSTGTKRDLLRVIGEGKEEKISSFLTYVSEKEPMLRTVLDLSRHTDEKVAEYASSLLHRATTASSIADYMADVKQRGGDNAISAVMVGMDKATADRWRLTEKWRSVTQSGHDLLIPTGSPQGDRYYIRADWDPENWEQVNCLAELFWSQLLAGRSLPAEKAIMKVMEGSRTAYWYSKEWAYFMKYEIEEGCEAQAFFVNGFTLKAME